MYISSWTFHAIVLLVALLQVVTYCYIKFQSGLPVHAHLYTGNMRLWTSLHY